MTKAAYLSVALQLGMTAREAMLAEIADVYGIVDFRNQKKEG